MLEKQSQLIEDVRNYQWMLREYERISKQIGEGDSTLKGLVNFKELRGSTSANTRLNETRNRYRKKIKRVNDALDLIDNDRDYAIVNCMLDGMSLSEVAEHIGLGRTTVYMVIKELEQLEKEHAEMESDRPVLREIRAHES